MSLPIPCTLQWKQLSFFKCWEMSLIEPKTITETQLVSTVYASDPSSLYMLLSTRTRFNHFSTFSHLFVICICLVFRTASFFLISRPRKRQTQEKDAVSDNSDWVGESVSTRHLFSRIPKKKVPLIAPVQLAASKSAVLFCSLAVIFLPKLETLRNLVNMHIMHHRACVCVQVAPSHDRWGRNIVANLFRAVQRC